MKHSWIKILSLSLIFSSAGSLTSIQAAVELPEFMATLHQAIQVGDVYEFIYLPESGVDVLRNSELLDTIAGLEFKKAFFGIWLSDNPVQKSLKKAMLGN